MKKFSVLLVCSCLFTVFAYSRGDPEQVPGRVIFQTKFNRALFYSIFRFTRTPLRQSVESTVSSNFSKLWNFDWLNASESEVGTFLQRVIEDYSRKQEKISLCVIVTQFQANNESISGTLALIAHPKRQTLPLCSKADSLAGLLHKVLADANSLPEADQYFLELISYESTQDQIQLMLKKKLQQEKKPQE